MMSAVPGLLVMWSVLHRDRSGSSGGPPPQPPDWKRILFFVACVLIGAAIGVGVVLFFSG